jgi:hypothetical protein
MRMKPASTTSAGCRLSITCGQLGVKGLTGGKALVVHHLRGDDPVLARQRQALPHPAVADDGRHLGAKVPCASCHAVAGGTMAAMLEPLPEIKITMFFIRTEL